MNNTFRKHLKLYNFTSFNRYASLLLVFGSKNCSIKASVSTTYACNECLPLLISQYGLISGFSLFSLLITAMGGFPFIQDLRVDTCPTCVRFEHATPANICWSSRHLEDVFKQTLKTSSRRLEDMSWGRCLEDMSSRPLQDMSSRPLQDVL